MLLKYKEEIEEKKVKTKIRSKNGRSQKTEQIGGISPCISMAVHKTEIVRLKYLKSKAMP